MASDLVADATEFTVSITCNVRRGAGYSYIPEPVLDTLGNHEGLRFVMRGNEILLARPD